MKKALSVLLVLMAVMSVAALAAELPTYTPADDGTYTIGYTEGEASNYYALLVVQGVYEEGATPVISEDTVLYIDQGTANANGDVSFDGWIPKTEDPATVYLGGSNLDAPVLLGYLGENTFTVSGTVTTDSDTTYAATVTLTGEDGTVYEGTATSGMYAVEVPAGTYTFTVNVKNHLSYTDADFVVSDAVSDKNVTVKGGDVNTDGVVNIDDLADLIKGYRTAGETDIDGSGAVDIDDLATLIKNYRETAVSE